VRKFALSVLVLVSAATTAAAQQAAPAKKPLSFDVASVKATGPIDPQKIASGAQRLGMKMDAGRVDIDGMSLQDLIMTAFKVKPYQISGQGLGGTNMLAGLMTAERYSIHATFPAGATTADMPEMLQALLVERFKLAYHREQKEQPIYALVVGKNGPALERSTDPDPPPPSAAPDGSNRPQAPQITGDPLRGQGMTINAGAAGGGTMKMNMSADGVMHLEASRMSMAQLAESLVQFVGRPVVDMTGLTGYYKIALDMAREDLLAMAQAMGLGANGLLPGGAPGGGPADPGNGATIFKSVEKMGLKLDARKSPFDSIVIDHVEKTPTED
jgi:uncharacterized protein (TIGR03435 family)